MSDYGSVEAKGLSVSNNGWMPPTNQVAPKRKNNLAIYLVIGAFALVVAVVLGFALASVVTRNDEDNTTRSDGSNVAENEEPKERVVNKGDEVDATDHESLAMVNEGRTLTGLGINYSGDPRDLYLVVTAEEGNDTKYSLDTYSTDESGQRIENGFSDLTDSMTVLAPEETGLHLKDGVTALKDEDDSSNSEIRCDNAKSESLSPRGDPGCAYVVSYWKGEVTAEAKNDSVDIIGVDGTGKVIFNREIGQSGQKVVPVVENGEIKVG